MAGAQRGLRTGVVLVLVAMAGCCLRRRHVRWRAVQRDAPAWTAGARRPGSWGFAAPVVSEFWSIVTYKGERGRPSRPEEALRFLAALDEAGAEIWSPGVGFGLRLAQLAADFDVAGNRISDLQIALCAFEGGAREIWTRDANFAVVPGLRRVRALE
jgi:predicted nucleic acid-binding protein